MNETGARLAFIYTLRDPESGRIRYVGKTVATKTRLNRHIFDARKGTTDHRSQWIRSMLARNLRPLLVVEDMIEEKFWPMTEAAYIIFFRELGFDLVNTSNGGDTGPDLTGRKLSARTCEKIRLSKLGPRNPNFGKVFSASYRKKLGASRRGRKDSEEVRRNKSEALTLWWAARKQLTGVI